MAWRGEGEHTRTRVLRGLVAGRCGASFVLPSTAFTEPLAAVTDPDLKAVESGFAAGMETYNRGDYQTALKRWNAVVALLPGTPEHRPNRIAEDSV